MNIACIVVWYYPEKLGDNIAINNILTYSNFFKTVYIIDNSDKNNQSLAIKIPNSVYIANLDNLGIAKALNQGCKKAMENSFDWVMTMDQDSNWGEGDNLVRYLVQVEILYIANEKNVSFGPATFGQNVSVLGCLRRKFFSRPEKNQDIELVGRIITSGNIIKLNIWKFLSGFNESLFIDEVDHEFCYRLRNNGYNINKINSCLMYHILGENAKYIFPHPIQHSGTRIYYSIRNIQFIKKNHFQNYKRFKYKSLFMLIILELIFTNNILDMKYVYKALKDAKNNIFGKYFKGNL